MLKFKFTSIVLGCICIALLSKCKQSSPSTAEQVSPYLNHIDSVKYLGINACKDCHADKYESFLETGMGQSFDKASFTKTSAKFRNVKPVYDAYLDLYYLPLLIDSQIYIKEYRLEGTDTVFSRTEKIKYIVGSGHHTNSHFTEENGFVFQAPLTFYTQKGQWDLPPGFENGQNTRFNRKIGLECMSCHNAVTSFSPLSDNRYEELPHGINCERCHGPGQVHVERMRKGEVVDVEKGVDYSIVNPRKLSWNRQIDICQRCHLQGNAVLKPGKTFLSFRPGMKLSETLDQFSPTYEGEEPFVMAAHAERFQKSACFIQTVKGDLENEKTRVGFTCISCHNPHVSVRKTNVLQYNNVCVSCHNTPKQKQCNDKKGALKSSNCVSCHMPSSGTSDIPHVTVHDHYIRKPQQTEVKTGALKGLRCVTNPNPDILTETKAYISYYEKFESNPLYLKIAEDKAKQLKEKELLHLQTLIHLNYVKFDYKAIIELASKRDNLNEPWSNYRISKAYEKEGQLKKAIEWMQLVVNQESQNLDFMVQFAGLLIKDKQTAKAIKVLKEHNLLYSKGAEAHALLGYANLLDGKLSEAKKSLLHSLSLDPDLMFAMEYLKQLYQTTGEKEAELQIDKRIQKLKSRLKIKQ